MQLDCKSLKRLFEKIAITNNVAFHFYWDIREGLAVFSDSFFGSKRRFKLKVYNIASDYLHTRRHRIRKKSLHVKECDLESSQSSEGSFLH